MSPVRRLVLLSVALLVFRIGSSAIVGQPGYTDAYYYADVARRLASGQGLTADFLWNFVEAGTGGTLPVASHRFWMPLASVLQAVGIAGLPFLDPFRAAQAMELLVAAFIPAAAYAASRSQGAAPNRALVAAILAGLGGAFAPAWVSLDAFAPAALAGTLFFLAYRRAATGDVRWGALAGLAVGLLFLARAEGALFGVALLALAGSPRARRAGVTGSLVALAIGLGWLARDLSLGAPPDLLARSALLVRYEDFFAIASPTLASFSASLPEVAAGRLAALGTNLITFGIAFGLLLVPGIARATLSLRARPEVRALTGLLVLVYLAESLVWTLHSTRGSYFHSLAAFVPFGVALGVVGTADLLGTVERGRAAAAGGVIAALAISSFAVAQWDASFNGPYRERVAVASLIGAGPFMAIDAAAWRWIAGRPVIVTPADGPGAACDAARRYGVGTIVLERAHFSRFDELYRATPGGDIKLVPVATACR